MGRRECGRVGGGGWFERFKGARVIVAPFHPYNTTPTAEKSNKIAIIRQVSNDPSDRRGPFHPLDTQSSKSDVLNIFSSKLISSTNHLRAGSTKLARSSREISPRCENKPSDDEWGKYHTPHRLHPSTRNQCCI